jgi:FtsZ-interacting cell division protein ZipA
VDAIKLFQPKSIQLNNKGIFEKKINDSFSYFIANLIEPGYFEDDQNISGFTFFFVASYEIDDKRHYEQMKKDIYEINSIINGKIIDDTRKGT